MMSDPSIERSPASCLFQSSQKTLDAPHFSIAKSSPPAVFLESHNTAAFITVPQSLKGTRPTLGLLTVSSLSFPPSPCCPACTTMLPFFTVPIASPMVSAIFSPEEIDSKLQRGVFVLYCVTRNGIQVHESEKYGVLKET